MDKETVTLVWSFTNDNKDIPYRISRVGRSKKENGNGVRWTCNCPSFSYRGGKTCKHLILMRQQVKSGQILNDNRFSVTEYGMEVLGLR
jgi:hypothetical protein